MVVMGGYSGQEALRDVWMSRDGGSNWTRLHTNAPWPARYHCPVVWWQDQIVILGGCNRDRHAEMCDVWTSKDGIEWDMVVEAPWPRRSAHAAVVFKGRVVVLGGYQEDFSPSCRLSDVWAGGGAEGDDLSEWEMLTAQGSWSGRCSHCVVVLNGQIFVLGGRSDVGRLNDVHASADGSEWHVVTSSAAWAPRSSFGSFVLGGFMYVVGGVSTDNDRFYNDVYRSVDGATWEAVCVSSPWSGRKCFSAVAAAVPLDDDGGGGGRK